MTNNDDWTRFCEMMEKAGWRYMPEESSKRAEGRGLHLFEHKNGAGYRTDGYWYYPGKDEPSSNVGDWRIWLEAGQVPPPF